MLLDAVISLDFCLFFFWREGESSLFWKTSARKADTSNRIDQVEWPGAGRLYNTGLMVNYILVVETENLRISAGLVLGWNIDDEQNGVAHPRYLCRVKMSIMAASQLHAYWPIELDR